jgi:hypothetical protein
LTHGSLSPVSTLELSSAVSAGPDTFGVTASVRKRSGGSFVNTRNSRALIIWHLTSCAGLAHGCVIHQEGNLNKSSFCSATGLWKLQNDTWVRGGDWCRQSTITWGSNRQAAHRLLFRHTRKCYRLLPRRLSPKGNIRMVVPTWKLGSAESDRNVRETQKWTLTGFGSSKRDPNVRTKVVSCREDSCS